MIINKPKVKLSSRIPIQCLMQSQQYHQNYSINKIELNFIIFNAINKLTAIFLWGILSNKSMSLLRSHTTKAITIIISWVDYCWHTLNQISWSNKISVRNIIKQFLLRLEGNWNQEYMNQFDDIVSLLNWCHQNVYKEINKIT